MVADRAAVDNEFKLDNSNSILHGSMQMYCWMNCMNEQPMNVERLRNIGFQVCRWDEGEKLQEQINKVVTEWLKGINEHPSFGSIENIETIDTKEIEYKKLNKALFDKKIKP
ncbi:hypothetical protein [Bacillus phage FI_KG-Lek]|nr:hypothetical protein [Bacillus phage FI_KG-Lek]